MSGGEHALPQPASDIQARAAEFLVARSDRNRWTPNDEAELDAWLAKSLAHQTAFWRLESIWGRADRLNALRPLASRNTSAPSPLRRRSLFLGLAAAVAAVAAIGGSTSLMMSNARTATYTTPIGGREIITLADGSSIELNTNTSLRTVIDARQRTVELLRGEALFNIKHDAAHPFVLVAANHRVIDLGTRFVVREDGGRLKVALIEGRARVETDSAGANVRSVLLKPGDEAVATAQGVSVTRKSPRKLDTELGWRRGVLVFQHATLVEVANEYNRYNTRKIVIGDADAGGRIITATLPTNDVAGFARMARNFLGLHVEDRGSEIVISR